MPRDAIVLIDHGSRRAEANAQLEALAERVAARRPDAIVCTAHLELVPPPLGEAIANCVQAGATRVLVHPFFLAPGRHTRQDIPQLLDEARAAHPGIDIVASGPLGLHDGVLEAVLGRLEEAARTGRAVLDATRDKDAP